MRKWIAMMLAVCLCTLLLAACSSNDTTSDGSEDNAVEVYATVQEDLTAGEYSPGQWEANEKGYFLIEYDYVSGEIQGVSIKRNDNFGQEIYAVPEPTQSGTYTTETIDFGRQDCEYALYLEGAGDYNAAVTIYFVQAS